MAAVCEICGKGPGFGNNVSHSHRRTPRRLNPNIQVRCDHRGRQQPADPGLHVLHQGWQSHSLTQQVSPRAGLARGDSCCRRQGGVGVLNVHGLPSKSQPTGAIGDPSRTTLNCAYEEPHWLCWPPAPPGPPGPPESGSG